MSSSDVEQSFTGRLKYMYASDSKRAAVTFKTLVATSNLDGSNALAQPKISEYLCANTFESEGALLYFRCVEGAYVIYSRDQNQQYGKCIGLYKKYLCVGDTTSNFDIATYDESYKNQVKFDLTKVDAGVSTVKISLNSLSEGIVGVYEQVDVAGCWWGYLYAQGRRGGVGFELTIVERNVDWVSKSQ